MELDECDHREAHWLPLDGIVGMWRYTCPCGLEAFGVSLADAKRVFGQKARSPYDGDDAVRGFLLGSR